MIDIRIENIKDTLCDEAVVSCVSGSGMPGATKYDVMNLQLKALKKIVDKKGKLTIDDIRDYQNQLKQIQFIKKYVNNKLKALSSE